MLNPLGLSGEPVAVRFEKDATAINNISQSTPAASQAYYDLQGRRISTPQKGMYIHNGKVYIKK